MLIDKAAPSFGVEACMPDNTFSTLKISDYRGKYVILFFWPADFTFVCGTEVPAFCKLKAELEKRDCVILGASTDTVHAHKGWKLLPKNMGGLGEAVNYPIIGDATKELAKAYDVLQDDGLCARGLFVIDKEGVVRAEHKNCDPLGRNPDEAVRLLDALIFHEKSKADGDVRVCPCMWKKGDAGLEPTMEGVAKFKAQAMGA